MCVRERYVDRECIGGSVGLCVCERDTDRECIGESVGLCVSVMCECDV